MSKSNTRKYQIGRGRPVENIVNTRMDNEEVDNWLEKIDYCKEDIRAVADVLIDLISKIKNSEISSDVIFSLLKRRRLKASFDLAMKMLKGE